MGHVTQRVEWEKHQERLCKKDEEEREREREVGTRGRPLNRGGAGRHGARDSMSGVGETPGEATQEG